MKNVSSRRRTFLFSLSIFFLIATGTRSFAQDLDTVTISGSVRDEQRAMIVGAEVQATLIKTGTVRKVVTDNAGRFRLIQLEPGTYALRVSCQGFATQEFAEIVTVAAQALQIDVSLKLAEISVEPVVITATTATPAVDAKRTVVGSTLTLRDMEALPLANRSVLDLIFTLPAVTEEPLTTRNLAEDRNTSHAQTPEEAGTFSLSGAPAFSNNLTIDGLDNNDDRAARERIQPSVEAIEEVQVITNQFSAEYGRASGGRINLRTRSGSKEFHGRAFYFFRDEALNANTFRNNSLGLSRLPLQEHVSGFTLSGPTKVAKSVLFFVAYETSKTLDSTLIDTLVPVQQHDRFPLPPPTIPVARRLEDAKAPALAADVAPFVSAVSTPLKNKSFSGRADIQFSDIHNGSVVYLGGSLFNLRQFSGGNRLFDALQATSRRSQSISFADNYVLSARLVNQARLQFSTLAPSFSAFAAESPVVLITLNDSVIEGDPARRSGTLVAGSSTSGGTDRRENRFQFQNIVSFLAGPHSLKLGVDIHRVNSSFADLSDVSGTFNFASAGDFLAGVPSRFRQNFHGVSTQANTYLGFFFQDEWQAFPQLVFSYGLRYERESILNDRNNLGPRVSFAYNPLQSARLVFRLGAGIFYNRALLRTIDDFTLGKQQLFFDTNALVDPSTGRLMSAAQRRDFIGEHIRFPESLAPDSQLVKDFGVLNTNFSRRLDPGLIIPSSYQVNIGAEFDLGRGYSVEANYTFNRGIHLWRELNINAPVLPPQYQDFSAYLASRDFPNFRTSGGVRPLHNTSTAGELVRFVYAEPNATAVSRVIEFGVPVSLINLRSVSSNTPIEVALAALNELRPDPARAEVEQLVSAGNSFYRGVTLELRRQFVASELLGIAFRSAYTYSSLVDDGVVNTSDALRAGDFRGERAHSLQDRKHRFVLSGIFSLPRFLGAVQLSPVWRVASGAPFNISLGGTDRNLDDVGNDRPNFNGDVRSLRWRAPGEKVDESILDQFDLPSIGQSGNLPRNAGRGPGLFLFDLNVARDFQISRRVKLRAMIEFDNVLNKTVFSFGSEFINFDALSPEASQEQRQKFLDTFLVASRTLRPRQIRVGLRLEF